VVGAVLGRLKLLAARVGSEVSLSLKAYHSIVYNIILYIF